MIKFFRHIRQQLLGEGKTGKYLKYAIGEILLVVIGILIALQINNWNEERKEQVLLNNVLSEIHLNLAVDLEDNLKIRINRTQELIDNLIDLEEHGQSMHIDSLMAKIALAHRITSWSPVRSGYDKFVSLGLEKSLQKDSLSGWLNFGFNSLNQDRQNTADNLTLYSLDKFRDYMIKHGYPYQDKQFQLRSPKNKEILKDIVKDLEFIGIIRNYQHTMMIQLEGYNRSSKRIESMLNKLDAYFKKKGIEPNIRIDLDD